MNLGGMKRMLCFPRSEATLRYRLKKANLEYWITNSFLLLRMQLRPYIIAVVRLHLLMMIDTNG